MAIASTTVFEVNVGNGSDTNAGAYNPSRSGATTDYTCGASAVIYSYTDLASTSGTTNPSVITSVERSFVSADVGNHIRINAGTNWTTGLYEIVSVSAGAATLDRAVGTSATLSSGLGKVGGAIASEGMAGGAVVAGNTVWIKAGNYPKTNLSANVSGGTLNTPNGTVATGPTSVLGYNTTRGDAPVAGNRPNIYPDASAGAWSNAAMNGGKFTIFAYLDFTNPQTQGENGLSATGVNSAVNDCSFDGFTANSKQGFSLVGIARRVRVTNCYYGLRTGGVAQFVDCSTANCTYALRLAGAASQAMCSATRCLFDGGICEVTGGTDDSCSYYNCTLVGGAYWMEQASATASPAVIRRCVQYGRSGYGVDTALAGSIPWIVYQDTAMGGNASGDFNPAIPSSRYSNITILSANPFVDAVNVTVSNRRYDLNVAAGGGALARSKSYRYPGTATTAYADYGAVQSRPGTGGGSAGATSQISS